MQVASDSLTRSFMSRGRKISQSNVILRILGEWGVGRKSNPSNYHEQNRRRIILFFWYNHIESIVTRASKRLYIFRVLRRNGVHSRPQRPRFFWSAPRIATSGHVQHRKSAHAQSQVWQIWLVLISIYCVYKAIQNRNVVGPGQRSRFLVLTKKSAASDLGTRMSGVETNDLITICTALIRSLLEYCCAVWHHALPPYLSQELERIQKCALKIIVPALSYSEALQALNLKNIRRKA